MDPDEDIGRIIRDLAETEDRRAWLAQHPEDMETLRAFLRRVHQGVEDQKPPETEI